MANNLDFPVVLRLLDERLTAFRELIASAPDLGAPVPTCPGWTLQDLAEHIGQGRRRWATIVAAGPSDTPPAPVPPAPVPAAELVAWLAESSEHLLSALREAGPGRGCWGWWAKSQSPRNSGAVARHQLQEVAVHTYDAQVALGVPEPLPEEVAVDGVDEFQSTCCSTTSAWPHEPATVDYHATEGRSWRVDLSAAGARVTDLPEPAGVAASASATGTASDLVLWFYGRIPADTLKLDGDPQIFDQLIAWDPGI